MSGQNGKTLPFRLPEGSRMGEEQPAGAATPVTETSKPLSFNQFALSMIPLTPVPFTGDSRSLFAYIRIAAYGLGSYLTFSKHRKVSYALMVATATCALTSFLDGAVKKS